MKKAIGYLLLVVGITFLLLVAAVSDVESIAAVGILFLLAISGMVSIVAGVYIIDKKGGSGAPKRIRRFGG